MRHRGFSIIEVLFAVMVLGIGFIMVAAMFPVAAQQTQANIDDTTGRYLAEMGAMQTAAIIRTVPAADHPALNTGTTFFRATHLANPVTSAPSLFLRDQVNTSTQYKSDPRYGYAVLYRFQNAGVNPLDVIAVAIRATNGGECTFETTCSDNALYPWHDTAPNHYDNVFIQDTATITLIPGSPAEVAFSLPQANGDAGAGITGVAVENAVFVIRTGAQAGQILRIGNKVEGADRWQISADSPVVPADTYDVCLAGRGLRNPKLPWNSATNPREGVSQVIGVKALNTQL